MAESSSPEALVATFFFGIVLLAASGTILLYIKGNASTFFRDELRLALVFFLINSSLWGLLGFIATLVSANAASGCQIVIAFAAAFDQLARITIEQFILWGTTGGLKLSKNSIILQVVIFLRFIMGAVFVGVQRPQFRPVCVASNSVLPVGIVVAVIDALMAVVLSLKACSSGNSRIMKRTRTTLADGKALVYVTVALGIWTGLSVPLLLGLQSTGLAVRTVVPAIGLLILIAAVAFVARNLTTPIMPPQLSPKAPSIDSFPPTELPTRTFPARGIAPQYQQMDGGSILLDYAVPRLAEPPRAMTGALPIISQPPAGQAVEGIGGMPVEGKLFPPVRTQTAPVIMEMPKRQLSRKDLMKGGKLAISRPVVDETATRTAFDKIATVDLATAAMKDRERRDMAPQTLFFNVNVVQPDQLPQSIPPEELKSKLQVSRKPVPNTRVPNNAQAQLIPVQPEIGVTSAVQLSPGMEEVRRRSPRQLPSEVFSPSDIAPPPPLKDLPTPDVTTPTLHIATAVMVPPPRSPRRSPPISPLQPKSPKQSNENTRSLLDPRTPPAIPTVPERLPRRQENKQMSETSGSHFRNDVLSPLVPRLLPSVLSPVEPDLEPVPEPIPEPELTTEPELVSEPMPEPEQELKPEPRLERKLSDGSAATSSDQDWPDSRKTLLPRSNSVKTNIRPSRQRPPSLSTTDDKPMKTPVQMRATAGLPRNPRPQATKGPGTEAPIHEQGMAQDQTIMFVNNLDDSDSAVTFMLEGDTDMAKDPSSRLVRDSVVHRPRPIPRKHARSASILEDLAFSVFPEDPTESGEQTPPAIPKAIAKDMSEGTSEDTIKKVPLLSPTGIQGSPARNVNDTASTAISPSRRRTVRRNSYVPELPVLPAEYQGQQPKITHESVIPGPYRTQCISKFSIDTSLSSDEPQSAYSRFSVHTKSSYEETIGRSSGVIIVSDVKAFAGSPAKIPETLEILDAGLTLTPKPVSISPRTARVDETHLIVNNKEGEKAAVIPIMLDISSSQNIPPTRGSLSSEGSRSGDETRQDSWHHRIGEELPSFSGRGKTRRSRKRAPPKPLSLDKLLRAPMIVNAEPSPLESPQEALNKIQEQLMQFDTSNTDSRATISERQRMTILANLESEMGMQESHWQKMRQDLARDSPSTIRSSPNLESSRNSFKSEADLHADVRNSKLLRGEKLYRLSSGSDRSLQFSKPDFLDDRTNRRSTSASGRVSLLSVTSRTIAQLGSPTPPDTDESGNDSDSDNTSHTEISSDTDELSSELSPRSQVSIALALDQALRDEIASQPKQLVDITEIPIVLAVATPSGSRMSIGSQPEAKSKEVLHALVYKDDMQASQSHADLEQRPQRVARRLTLRPPRRSRRISLLPDILENPEPITGNQDTLGIFQFPWGEKSDSATVQPKFAPMPGTMSSGRPWICPATNTRSRPRKSQDRGPIPIYEAYGDSCDNIDSSDSSHDDDSYDDSFDEATLWEIASLLKTDQTPSRDKLIPLRKDSWEEIITPKIEAIHDAETASEETEDDPAYDFIPVTLVSEAAPIRILQTPPLWTRKAEQVQVGPTTSPSQPEGKPWTSYIVLASPRTVRTRPQIEEPAAIMSASLWLPKSTKTAESSTTGLWSMRKKPDTPSPIIMESSQELQTQRLHEPEESNTRPGKEKEKPKQVTFTADVMKLPKTPAGFLWSPPAAINDVPSIGLRQPDPRVWNMYLPPTTRSVCQQLRTVEAPKLESRSLWTTPKEPQVTQGPLWLLNRPLREAVLPAQVSKPPSIGSLWSTPAPIERTVAGLKQPDPKVWDTYLPTTNRIVRQKFQMAKPAKLKSRSLWAPSKEIYGVRGLLWIPNKPSRPTSSDEFSRDGREIAATPMLWSWPTPRKNAVNGLPQPDSCTWNAYVSTTSRMVRHKSRTTGPSAIESRSLWTAPKEVQDTLGLLWCPAKLSKAAAPEQGGRSTEEIAPSEPSVEERSESKMESEASQNMQPEYVLSNHGGDEGTSRLISQRTLSSPTGLTFTQNWLSPTTVPSSPGGSSSVYSAEDNSLATSNTVLNANRRTMPVFMTRDQWDSAFREAIQETTTVNKQATRAAWATEDEWAATLNKASSSVEIASAFYTRSRYIPNALRTLNSSYALNNHSFGPSVRSIASDYTKKPMVGNINSIKQEPTALTNTSPVPVDETPSSQHATNDNYLWTKLPISTPERSSSTMWQPRYQHESDTSSSTFVNKHINNLPISRRTTTRRAVTTFPSQHTDFDTQTMWGQ